MSASDIVPVPRALLVWMNSGDTGMSSKAIAFASVGVFGGYYGNCPPSDPADLGRCLRLLYAVPSASAGVDGLAERSPLWAALHEDWADLRALMVEECGGHDPPLRYGWTAPKSYDAMKRTLARGAAALAQAEAGSDQPQPKKAG